MEHTLSKVDTVSLDLMAVQIAEITSMQDWINRAPHCLPEKRKAEVRIWIDRFGACLAIGKDFMVCKDADSYPVKVYSLIRAAEIEGYAK